MAKRAGGFVTNRSFVGLFIVLTTVCGCIPLFAQVQAFPNQDGTQVAVHTLRGKAKPDECFAYMSSPSPLPTFSDPTRCDSYPTQLGMPPSRPKVNQGYIWGLTTSGDDVWWGTFANPNCITVAGSIPTTANPNGAPNAEITDAWACEFFDSPYYPGVLSDARLGDFRPPRIYSYSQTTHLITDRTPKFPNAFQNPTTNPEGLYNQLNLIRGIRSATTYNGVIMLAGPSIAPATLIFLAWNASTGEFLGGRSVIGYNNIRNFRELNGVLYTAVGKNSCASPTSCQSNIIGGRILRVNPTIVPNCQFNPTKQVQSPPPCWNLNGTTQTPDEVGNLDTIAGSFTIHNGRIFTVTWPTRTLPGVVSSLYMSPAIPQGGLTTANANDWTQLWKATDYEPDSNMALIYSGGALASFDGYLWWGTLIEPGQALAFLLSTFPPGSQQNLLDDLAGTMRAATLFRGKDLDTPNPTIELVYGNTQLPVFTPPANGNPQSWALQTNKMPNPKSLWGPAGIGNVWNTYMWSMQVWNNRLWVGTMDWSFLSMQGSQSLTRGVGLSFPAEIYAAANPGGDLFYFTDSLHPAFPESSNGVGNPTSIGIRNQVVGTNGNAFLGMANASNLLTDPTDPKHLGGLGGWELIEMSPSPNLNTPVGTNVPVSLPNNMSINFCSVTNAGTTFTSTTKNPFRWYQSVNPLLAPSDINGPPLPPGVGRQPSDLILLWTSAAWGQGCNSPTLATVTLKIPGDVSSPRLLQLYWDGTQYLWRDITSNVSPTAGTIDGAIGSDYLGVLAVASSAEPSVTVSIAGKGFANGSFYVDLKVKSVGTRTAYAVSLDQLSFRPESGNGTIKYDTTLSAALPRSLGNIAPDNSATVRLYLRASSSFGETGVKQFSLIETVALQNANGVSYTETYSQEIVP